MGGRDLVPAAWTRRVVTRKRPRGDGDGVRVTAQRPRGLAPAACRRLPGVARRGETERLRASVPPLRAAALAPPASRDIKWPRLLWRAVISANAAFRKSMHTREGPLAQPPPLPTSSASATPRRFRDATASSGRSRAALRVAGPPRLLCVPRLDVELGRAVPPRFADHHLQCRWEVCVGWSESFVRGGPTKKAAACPDSGAAGTIGLAAGRSRDVYVRSLRAGWVLGRARGRTSSWFPEAQARSMAAS